MASLHAATEVAGTAGQDRVNEVAATVVSICIGFHSLLEFLNLAEFAFPLFDLVHTLRRLEPIQHFAVLHRNSGLFFDPDPAVERVIVVQSLRIVVLLPGGRCDDG